MHIANQHEGVDDDDQSLGDSNNFNINLHSTSTGQISITNMSTVTNSTRAPPNVERVPNEGPATAGRPSQSDHQPWGVARSLPSGAPSTGANRARPTTNHVTVTSDIHPTAPAASAAATAAASVVAAPLPLAVSPSLPPSLHNPVVMASIHSLHPQQDLKLNNRFMLMPSNDQIRELQTVIRDKATARGNFKFYADRLIRLVVEEGLNQLPIERVDVKTPTGNTFHGIRYLKGNCGVSIVRSGESMEQGLRDCCRSIRIGKILIESDENNQARVLYTKFPRDIAERKILLLYPIMSTGLAVIESVKVLLSHGVREENLILLNLFSSPRAAKMISHKYPNMFALTSDINAVCPNHFGQRYFGTD